MHRAASRLTLLWTSLLLCSARGDAALQPSLSSAAPLPPAAGTSRVEARAGTAAHDGGGGGGGAVLLPHGSRSLGGRRLFGWDWQGLADQAQGISHGAAGLVDATLHQTWEVAGDGYDTVRKLVDQAMEAPAHELQDLFEKTWQGMVDHIWTPLSGNLKVSFQHADTVARRAYEAIGTGAVTLSSTYADFSDILTDFRPLLPCFYLPQGPLALSLNASRMRLLGTTIHRLFKTSSSVVRLIVPVESISNALHQVADILAWAVGKAMDALSKVLELFQQVSGWAEHLLEKLGLTGQGDSPNATITHRVNQWVSQMFDSPAFSALKTSLDKTVEALRPVAIYFSDMWDDTAFFVSSLRALANETHHSLMSVRRLKKIDEALLEDLDTLSNYSTEHLNRLSALMPNWEVFQHVLNKTCQLIARALDLIKPVLDGVCWVLGGVVDSVQKFLSLSSSTSTGVACKEMVASLATFAEQCDIVTALEIVERVIQQSMPHVSRSLALCEFLLRNPNLLRVLVGIVFFVVGLVELIFGARVPQTNCGLAAQVFLVSFMVGSIVSGAWYALEAPHCFNVTSDDDLVPASTSDWYCSPSMQDAAPVLFALIATVALSPVMWATEVVKGHIYNLGVGAGIGLVGFSAVYLQVEELGLVQDDLLDEDVAVRILRLMALCMAMCGALTVWIMSSYTWRALVASAQGAMHLLIGRHMLFTQKLGYGNPALKLGHGYPALLLCWAGLVAAGTLLQLGLRRLAGAGKEEDEARAHAAGAADGSAELLAPTTGAAGESAESAEPRAASQRLLAVDEGLGLTANDECLPP